MDETMKNEIEVTTETVGADEITQEIEIEEIPSGPSKGFVGLVIGGALAIGAGAAVAIKRYKRKKAESKKSQDENEESDIVDIEAEEISEEEESDEKPKKKK